MTNNILPSAHAAFVDANGRPARAAYIYFANLQNALGAQEATNTDTANALATLAAQIAELQARGSTAYWGSIVGDLSDQTDLQAALDTKLTHGQTMARVSLGW